MGLAAAAALTGAFVQSTTGFGFALVLSPALFAVMDPVEAVMTLLVLGLVLSLLVLFEGGRPKHVDWRSLAPMLAAALPGLAVGAVALTQLSKSVLQVAVGVAVVAVAAWQLRRRRRGAEPHRVPGGIAGFTSGALTTSINVSGPPIVLWLEARGASPEEFRASLAATFLVLDLAGGAVLLVGEGSGSIDAGRLGPLLALVIAGYALGAVAFRRLNRERFYTLVLALVACTGVASIVAGLA
ncbi:MAG TPA: sulfite exporter TauE/SafE family protein [Thermoleophilaceae bacterium]|jgi:uncharacterized membrane protein YfcA|nr:sulfite exporter TauE/SafE family protein [Thermoleophilaceae bacterium]